MLRQAIPEPSSMNAASKFHIIDRTLKVWRDEGAGCPRCHVISVQGNAYGRIYRKISMATRIHALLKSTDVQLGFPKQDGRA